MHLTICKCSLCKLWIIVPCQIITDRSLNLQLDWSETVGTSICTRQLYQFNKFMYCWKTSQRDLSFFLYMEAPAFTQDFSRISQFFLLPSFIALDPHLLHYSIRRCHFVFYFQFWGISVILDTAVQLSCMLNGLKSNKRDTIYCQSYSLLWLSWKVSCSCDEIPRSQHLYLIFNLDPNKAKFFLP